MYEPSRATEAPRDATSQGDSATAAIVDAARARVLAGARWVALLVVLPLQLFSVFRVPHATWPLTGALVQSVAILAVTAGLWALRGSRPRVQASIVVVGVGFIAAGGLPVYGPLAGLGGAFGIVTVFAVLFFGWRAGLLSLGWVVLCFGLGAYGAHAGVLAFPPGTPSDLSMPINWVRIGWTVVATCTGMLALVAGVLAGLERALREMTDANARAEAAREERERAVRALADAQRLEALGRLAGGVAHDVNNTLSVVLCNAELIQRAHDLGEVRELADDIRHAAQSAEKITRELLAFGRGATGRRTAVDPRLVLERLGRSLGRLLPPNIEVKVDAPSTRRIAADEVELEQALLNLALNARDAMPDGGTLTLRARDADRDGVAFEVADTGTGMDEATRARIFEPFFSTKDRGKGTGLGLALVHGIVTRHDGHVHLESELGRGTTFRLEFPPGLLASTDDPSREVTPTKSGHVLLVEDLPELRTAMRRWLQSSGFTVTDVADLDAARAASDAPGAHFDVLLTDAILPGSQSITALADAFRARHGGPVVVCSGHVEEELVRRGIETGRYAFVRKPFVPTALLDVVGRALAEWHARTTAA